MRGWRAAAVLLAMVASGAWAQDKTVIYCTPTEARPESGLFGSEGSTWQPSLEAGVWSLKGKGDWAGATCKRLPLAADKVYSAGARIKFRGPGAATVKVDYFRGDQWIGGTEAGPVKETESWQQAAVVDRRAEYPGADTVAVSVVATVEGEASFREIFIAEMPRLENERENLIKNGRFEIGVGERPTGWNEAKPEGETPKVVWAADAARTGGLGLRLKGATTWHVMVNEDFTLDRAKTYTLTGWVRARSGAGAIKFDFKKHDDWLTDQNAEPMAKADGEWHQLKVVLDPAKSPDANRIAPAVLALGPNADVDFDDLVLTVK